LFCGNKKNTIEFGIKMIDWGFIAKLTGGGFGVTILVLTILTIVIWLVGFLVQRVATRHKE
ncbi:MAG: hypothetical protein OEW82_01995, partial [Dehalococcoidia bacterium]|nr:hypothetical protein [Dehalococcoidia bacterium]